MARRGEDLSNVEFETSEDVQVVPTFNSMGLREELLRAIYAYGECIVERKCLVTLDFVFSENKTWRKFQCFQLFVVIYSKRFDA